MTTVNSTSRPLSTARTTAAASSTPTLPTGTLDRGDKGTAVAQLQTALVKLGNMTQAEMNTGRGIFGPRTEAALKEFQAKHKLVADGVYGPKTRAAMQKALAPAAPPKPPSQPKVTAPAAGLDRGDSGAAVKQLQSALVKTGHLSQADMNTNQGVQGPKTVAVV